MSVKKIAIVQHSSVHLDKVQSIEKLRALVEDAAAENPAVITLGECWLSGYPAWLDYCPGIGFWDSEPMKEVYLKFWNSSISLEEEAFNELLNIAKDNNTCIVIGVNEKVGNGPGNGTVYNSILTISEKGILLNHHRKMMPTFTEKLLHGIGDGVGLNSVKTNAGRVTSAICWEHWMPLMRQALHNQGEDIHIAMWPMVHDRHLLASRHYAFEGRCFVMAAGQILRVKDFPAELEIPDDLARDSEKMILNGGSCFIGPNGQLLGEQVFDQETILHAEVDLDEIVKESMTLDVTGHYQRSDIFEFRVNQTNNRN